MNILPLAALPAATHVARDAVAGGAKVGQGFFKLLNNLTGGGEAKAADAEAASETTELTPTDSVTERTQSFSQRLSNWLRQQPWLKSMAKGDGSTDGTSNGALAIELSLDELDRPHATLAGQPSQQLDEALANDPSWLDEFRHLALDRAEQMGPTNSNSMTQYLTIEQESATMDAAHQWK